MEAVLKFGILLNFLRLAQFEFNDIDEDIITIRDYVLWPKATIPFYINPTQFDKQQQTTIMSALATFAFKTCLKFAPLLAPPRDDQHVMVFENPDGEKKCTISTSGHSIDEPHRIRVGYHCLEAPWVDLLIMRGLGFPLEHNRASRDSYIDVQEENIDIGAMELFVRQPKLPLELQSLPYDYNSVLHFGPRDYSKNGHRTIIFKSPDLQQNRIGLSLLDIRKIELVYGPQCRERDREEKFELCKKYPAVDRKKRDVNYDTVQNLRVNRNIKPPEITPDELPAVLLDLGVHREVQEIVDQVYEVSKIALQRARDKHCNKTKPILRTNDEVRPSNTSDILGVIENVAEYIKTMVDNALVNITEFCETSENIEKYVRAGCPFYDKRNCPQTYRSTKSGPVKYSTQHRPLIRQSTKHSGIGGKKQYAAWRAGNETDFGNETTTEPATARRKRDTENENANKEANITAEKVIKDKDKAEIGKEDNSNVGKNTVDKGDNVVTDKTELAKEVKVENDKVDSKVEKDKVNSTAEKAKPSLKLDNNSLTQLKLIEETIKSVAKVFKNHFLNTNKTMLRFRATTILSNKARFHSNHRSNYYNDDSKITKYRRKRSATNLTNDTPKDVNNSTITLENTSSEPKAVTGSPKLSETESSIATESPKTTKTHAESTLDRNMSHNPTVRYFRRFRMKRVKDNKADNEGDDSNVSLEKTPKIYKDIEESMEKYKGRREKKEKYKKRPHRTGEGKGRSVPRTVKLSKQNQEFYDDRRWPGGVVRYYIQEDDNFDTQDMRDRLTEVNDILKRKTCVRIEEISEAETEKYNDYLVLDNSPDYVTGRVGNRQNFGVLELFRGGQHRQHAAMMVMAMLGFYFEVARHDRDKYIRVHRRHVRPDKLHHFEKLRGDATLPLPYDYKSATHPAWQFWRQVGRTGISTVATFKEKDPDGSVMKSLGQNEELLSELDLVKINSVYGVKCFKKRM